MLLSFRICLKTPAPLMIQLKAISFKCSLSPVTVQSVLLLSMKGSKIGVPLRASVLKLFLINLFLIYRRCYDCSGLIQVLVWGQKPLHHPRLPPVIIYSSYRQRITGSVTSMARLGHQPDKISESSVDSFRSPCLLTAQSERGKGGGERGSEAE